MRVLADILKAFENGEEMVLMVGEIDNIEYLENKGHVVVTEVEHGNTVSTLVFRTRTAYKRYMETRSEMFFIDVTRSTLHDAPVNPDPHYNVDLFKQVWDDTFLDVAKKLDQELLGWLTSVQNNK